MIEKFRFASKMFLRESIITTGGTMKPNIDFGKLFIDFVLSKKGQMVLENCERLPARPDMDTESLRAFKGIKLYPSVSAAA